MKYLTLKEGKYIEEKDNKGLSFLYNTYVGRILLKLVISKQVRNLYNKYLNSKYSKHKIKKFIKKNNININRYENKEYLSFNDFFKRKIKKVNIEDGLFSIADAKLSVYKIDNESKFYIKNSLYTVDELLGDDGSNFSGGYAYIYRLCVDDYHRYLYLDDGEVLKQKKIDGVFHTVQPLAFKRYKVFLENAREVTYLKTKRYGIVAQVEIGAMMIGKIVNENKDKFKRGEEKGHFEFGGSTIVLLFEKDSIKPNPILLKNTKNEIETVVKIGESLE